MSRRKEETPEEGSKHTTLRDIYMSAIHHHAPDTRHIPMHGFPPAASPLTSSCLALQGYNIFPRKHYCFFTLFYFHLALLSWTGLSLRRFCQPGDDYDSTAYNSLSWEPCLPPAASSLLCSSGTDVRHQDMAGGLPVRALDVLIAKNKRAVGGQLMDRSRPPGP